MSNKPRSVESGENVEPKVPQVSIDALAEKVTHVEFRATFQVLAQVVTTQENREFVAPVKQNVGTAAMRIRDFSMMNPPEFHGSKIDEDPQDFIDKVYKIVGIIRLSMVDKVELATYQPKGVAQVWFEQWKSNMSVKEYALKFTRLAKYTLAMVAYPRERMRSSNSPTPKFNKDRVSNPKPQGYGGNG
ncbi:hypothetical protein MTR67_043227 [Solanum verrucosum]|uniref:Gag-pol polyprotein n=1 Tax=Solanum verrucosum TaxID=315347 RepID=A0AAF0UP98_SOLVR|nr:hypothetical protein MTR67_043227 [Solanum verrucosum]